MAPSVLQVGKFVKRVFSVCETLWGVNFLRVRDIQLMLVNAYIHIEASYFCMTTSLYSGSYSSSSSSSWMLSALGVSATF